MAKAIYDREKMVKLLKQYTTLTGSRRFLNRQHSDWDFVVGKDDITIKNILKREGFEPVFKEYAPVCSDTAEIWQKDYSRTMFGSEKDVIQVVFSKRYEDKKRVIKWLESHPDIVERYYQTEKKHRHRIWQILQEYAKEKLI